MKASTIAALATPGGRGGIGIIKISGPDAVSIARGIFRSGRKCSEVHAFRSHRLYYGRIVDPQSGKALDEVLLSVMKAPFSYTCEDVVEINSHGGPVVVNAILGIVLGAGARLAEPGEFTKRAFVNGRIDLTQAEAVIDLINARSRKALEFAAAQIDGDLRQRIEAVRDFLVEVRVRLEAAMDFPEDVGEVLDTPGMVEQIHCLAVQPLAGMIRGYQAGRMFREGAKLAIVGRPNVGKSSLLNRLVGKQRAIVTDIPGTTRDVVEAAIQLKGVPVNLMDTAGYHQSCGLVEQIGIEKTRECISDSDGVVFMVEANRALGSDDRELYEMIRAKPHVVAVNKSDIAESSAVAGIFGSLANDAAPILISALHNQGIDELKEIIFGLVAGDEAIEIEDSVVPNLRQQGLLEKSLEAVKSGLEGLRHAAPSECVSIDLAEAVQKLGSILGISATVDILDRIFSQFCIGK
jgi:tRNA modification GTPase